MRTVGGKEKQTQERVIAFFEDALGYTYLGNWQNLQDNSNIDKSQLTDWLRSRGHDDNIISKTLRELESAAALRGSKTPYSANREVYRLLRYGVNVQPRVGEQHVIVRLIDWKNPRNNTFGIAEEVTLKGESSKRPDLVLYINGIALGVLELKRATVSVSEGIRQNLDNQKQEFIRGFFTTVQLLMAGNETEGLRYSVIETPEKHWLRWKEADTHPDTGANPLHWELSQLCSKERLLEILHDFIVFDAGTKKICRHNQFFGVKAAQARVRCREGGIIWHTQGSGKSLTMVWLAKWIREHISDARVLIITDRTELDEQIEQVFKGVNEDIYRTRNGAELVHVLSDPAEWLVCSLIHKFGKSGEISAADVEKYVAEIKQHLPGEFRPKGEFFVFVDECHRTQSGKLHKAMKTLLPDAMLIGFTGTPLLKRDKQQSIESFGPYIHTYKYDEAVGDNVVLDLRYEARDVDQNLTSQNKIDQWFDSKTGGLTDVAKAQLKQRWGTMQKVLSSRDRLEKIVADILFDMETRDRLKSGRGNALLVSDSIYSACRFFERFQDTELDGKCAIVTSYRPTPDAIRGEETGEGVTERLLKYNTYRKMLAAHFNEPEGSAVHKVEQFEQAVKKTFVEHPGQMKLLIVVDKLLTGFDAPPATYLYIDKRMQDHGLFQAICRVNRLDGEDKEYGYIIDYKDLFRSLEKAIRDYTGEAFENYAPEDVKGLLKDRLQQGKERLAETREAIKALCEPVEEPRDSAAYIRFFCSAENGNVEQLKANAQKRVNLYKGTAAFLRAYANIANEMHKAGYTDAAIQEIKGEVTHYENVRQEVKLASGDYIDMKMYEPAMRHLLDTYIRAEESETFSKFDDIPLVQLIDQQGAAALDLLPEGIRINAEAMAATIENNVRRLIVDKAEINPKYYENMSKLLDALIRERKQGALNYQDYLSKITDMSGKISEPENQPYYPSRISSAALRSLFDNLGDAPAELREEGALALDNAIRSVKKDDWRGHKIKQLEVRRAIEEFVAGEKFADYAVDVDVLFEIVTQQDEY